MVKKNETLYEEREEEEHENDADDEEEEDDEKPKGSRIAQILQKPFDFISMMVQFIIYFMVRMATEGCMLPIPELEDHENDENNEDDDGDDVEEVEDSKTK